MCCVVGSVAGVCWQAAAAWTYAIDSPFNRRITANTPMEMAGPAGRHPLLGGSGGDSPVTALGTLCNCAASTTPWGTYLTAAENVDIFFGNLDAASLTPDLERAYARLPPRPRGQSVPLGVR